MLSFTRFLTSAAVATLLASTGTVRAHAAEPRLQHVGDMAAGEQSGVATPYALTIDPSTQLGFMVTSANNVPIVRVFDLRTLRAIRDLSAPAPNNIGGGAGGAPFPVLDERRHRLIFYLQRPATPAPGSCAPQPDNWGILDELTLTWQQLPIPCLQHPPTVPNPTAPTAFAPLGMYYDEAHDAFYVAGYDSSENVTMVTGTVHHYLRAVDSFTGEVLWEHPLSDCNGDDSYAQPWNDMRMGRYGDVLSVACRRSDQAGEITSNNQFLNVLARVRIAGDGSPPADLPPAWLVGDDFSHQFDDGSGLIATFSTDPHYDLGAYITDSTTGFFRGFVPTAADPGGADSPLEMGMDTGRGRLYMRTENGLVISDVRHVPVPVGISLSDFAAPAGDAPLAGSGLAIAVDTAHHRIYIPEPSSGRFRVYQDDIPETPSTVAPNPDGATVDVAEAPGVTGAAYSSSGDAYGMRVLSEGGANRFLYTRTGLCPAPPPYPSCYADSAVSPGDRDWSIGHVTKLSSSNLGVSAQAAALDAADSATASDMQRYGLYGTTVGSTAVPGVAQSGLVATPIDRPQDQPTCRDFGGGGQSAGEHTAAGTAQLSCDQAHASVSAMAVGGAGGPGIAGGKPASAPVDVGYYWSGVSTSLDPTQGLVTTAIAEAHDVRIPVPGAPPILIRDVITTATAVAHGRPGTAHGGFTRSIDGFSSPSYSCDADCDPQKVADAIGPTLQSAGIVGYGLVPQPDPADVHGSRGGYQAVVTKDAGLRASENTVNDDASDTVAGLEVVMIFDGSAGRTREVLQLAALHVESHYGIYLLGQASTALDGSGAASPPSAGTVLGGGDLVAPRSRAVGAASGPAQAKGGDAPSGVLGRVLGVLHEGWRLLVSDPLHAAMLAGLWSLLLAPAYLAARRRALLDNNRAPR